MLLLSDFRVLSPSDVYYLRGGKKHYYYYFLAFLDPNHAGVIAAVQRMRLLNQMGSQRPPSYPKGYLLFLTPYGEWPNGWRRYCLDRQDFPSFRLGLPRFATTPRWEEKRRPAVILATPPRGSLKYHALMREHRRSVWQQKIRYNSTGSRFGLVFELLETAKEAPGQLSRERQCNRTLAEQVVEFEGLLSIALDDVLRDLAALVGMPENTQPPPALAACQAAN